MDPMAVSIKVILKVVLVHELIFHSSNSVFQNKPVGGAEHSLRSLWLLLNRKERTTYITDGNERFRPRIKQEQLMLSCYLSAFD